MPNPINIYCQKNKNILNNYDNIDVSEISNIINHSAGLIKFDHLEKFNYDMCNNILSILLNKLKLGGKLLLCVHNIKVISKLYADNILTDQDFLSALVDNQSIWSIDYLEHLIHKNYNDTQISKIQIDNINNLIYITIERYSI